MQKTHGETHFDPDVCYGCKIITVGVAPSAMPSRHPGPANQVVQEKKLVKDLDAYKRLRLDGENPKSTRGAARFESEAQTSYEITSGQLARDKAKGYDARKPLTKRGSEWAKRAQDAFRDRKAHV